MISDLRRREVQLEHFGWCGPKAEGTALVCLHSRVFTRAQFCAYFDCRPNRELRFVRQLLERRQGVEEPLHGLATRRGPAIYRAGSSTANCGSRTRVTIEAPAPPF